MPTWREQKKWCTNGLVPINLHEKVWAFTMAKGTPRTPLAVQTASSEGQPIPGMLPIISCHLLPTVTKVSRLEDQRAAARAIAAPPVRHPRSLLLDGWLEALEHASRVSSSKKVHRTVFRGWVFWLFVLTGARNIPPKELINNRGMEIQFPSQH